MLIGRSWRWLAMGVGCLLLSGCAWLDRLEFVQQLPTEVPRPSRPGIGASYAAPYALYLNAWAGAATGPVRVAELDPWQDTPTNTPRVVWEGELQNELVMFRRFDGARDRLASKFLLLDAQNRPIGGAHYIDRIEGISANRELPARPAGIKGLRVQMLDDALALGVKTAAWDVMLDEWIDWDALRNGSGLKQARHSFTAEGEIIPLRAERVAAFDAQLRAATRGGIWNYLVLLQGLPGEGKALNPMLPPRLDGAEGARWAAWHLGDARGLAWFRGWVHFLAERYTRADGRNGKIVGLILGNEVNAHQGWHAMCPTTPEELVNSYTSALRVADRELRLLAPEAHVFVSLDHHWNEAPGNDPLRSAPGRLVLDLLSEKVRREGDFPWGLAHHPNPENLREPRAWLDVRALPSLATPKITFKNVEVLAAWLRQPGNQYEGKPRRLILSEQGCNTPPGPEGEQRQAAGFAYAWQRIRQIPEIEAFMYHQHVDHRDQDGLQLGLWTRDETTSQPDAPARQKPIHALFKAAETPEWDSASAFTLPLIGIRDWNEIRPDDQVELAATARGLLTLARNGSSRYRIVLPDEPTGGDRTAATLLGEALAAITGTAPRVLAESDLDPGDSTQTLHLGLTRFARQHVPDAQRPEAGQRGVLLKPVQASYILLGDPAGPNDAAQVFLERCCGAGWFGEGRLALPIRPTLTIPALEFSHIPPKAWLTDAQARQRRFLAAWPPRLAPAKWDAALIARGLERPEAWRELIHTQQAWDPTRNARVLEYEAAQAWYGDAGDLMLRYFNWLEAEQARVGLEALLSSAETRREALNQLEDARDTAEQSGLAMAPIRAFAMRGQTGLPPDADPEGRVLHAMLPWWQAELKHTAATPENSTVRQRLAGEIERVVGKDPSAGESQARSKTHQP